MPNPSDLLGELLDIFRPKKPAITLHFTAANIQKLKDMGVAISPEPVTRADVETFLAAYHEQVWEAAAASEDLIHSPADAAAKRKDYDEAGAELAEAFLARFE